MRILGAPKARGRQGSEHVQPSAGAWGPEPTDERGIQLAVRLNGASFSNPLNNPRHSTSKTSFYISVQFLPAVWSRRLHAGMLVVLVKVVLVMSRG